LFFATQKNREVSEWLKEQAWKVCIWVTVSWVRIPSSLQSYLFYDEYKLETSSGNVSISNNKDLNPFQFGVYVSAGWNTVNVFAYYGLNSFFKSGTKIDGNPLDVNGIRFGLMFYIL
jgi:hypothetical protein